MLQSPLRILGRLPGPVRLLVWGTLVNKLGTFIFPYLSLVLMRDFGMTPARAGLLMTCHGLGAIVSVLTGGVLTDRLGRRRTLLLSMFGGGILAVAMGFAPSLGSVWMSWMSCEWNARSCSRPSSFSLMRSLHFSQLMRSRSKDEIWATTSEIFRFC